MNTPPRFSIILPAGGNSSRFGSDKLTATLGGVPVITRTVSLFAGRDDVGEIIIATNRRAELEPFCKIGESGQRKAIRWAPAGGCRAETVLRGVELASGDWIAIHDAARPLTPAACIDRVFAAALEHGAAAPALPVKLTIKQAAGPLPALAVRTLARQALCEMQTPQAMCRADLLAAYQRCALPLAEVTDDAQLLEQIGLPVMLVMGDERNIKLTTAADLQAAELLLAS